MKTGILRLYTDKKRLESPLDVHRQHKTKRPRPISPKRLISGLLAIFKYLLTAIWKLIKTVTIYCFWEALYFLEALMIAIFWLLFLVAFYTAIYQLSIYTLWGATK